VAAAASRTDRLCASAKVRELGINYCLHVIRRQTGHAVEIELICRWFCNPASLHCKGEDISPPLEWSDVPVGTKSYALFCDDPDAPGGT
jgi:phosphatidylethanolamine-binding protein (PEBP) family uncharacterized protein